MTQVTTGEKWKMELLGGNVKPSEATDQLMDNIIGMTNKDVAQILLPMAELRASQISRGLNSEEASTRAEAERMEKRYTGHDVLHPEQEATAKAVVQQEAGDKSELTRAIASSWLEKILTNDRVGEMEKELQRTVDTYKTEKQESRLSLKHSRPVQAAAR